MFRAPLDSHRFLTPFFVMLGVMIFSSHCAAAAEPELVKDINSLYERSMTSTELHHAFGDKVLFANKSDDEGEELWITDGT
ncbi:MAG: hypothetical protein KDD62_11250, partial [Bdellovibrionales bacterium]|nr:hypothetical protein [Bdellovibrionales bacterium]